MYDLYIWERSAPISVVGISPFSIPWNRVRTYPIWWLFSSHDFWEVETPKAYQGPLALPIGIVGRIHVAVGVDPWQRVQHQEGLVIGGKRCDCFLSSYSGCVPVQGLHPRRCTLEGQWNHSTVWRTGPIHCRSRTLHFKTLQCPKMICILMHRLGTWQKS